MAHETHRQKQRRHTVHIPNCGKNARFQHAELVNVLEYVREGKQRRKKKEYIPCECR